jgi:hypothetical protein
MKWLKNLIKKIKLEIRYRQFRRRSKDEDPFIYF